MTARVSSAWVDSRRRLRERKSARTHSPRSGFVPMRYPPATRCTVRPRSSGSQALATASNAARSASLPAPGNNSTRSSIVKGSSAANTRASTIACSLPPCGGAVSVMIGPCLLDRRRRLVRQDDQDVLPVVADVRPHQAQSDDLQEGKERQNAGDAVDEPAEQGPEIDPALLLNRAHQPVDPFDKSHPLAAEVRGFLAPDAAQDLAEGSQEREQVRLDRLLAGELGDGGPRPEVDQLHDGLPLLQVLRDLTQGL